MASTPIYLEEQKNDLEYFKWIKLTPFTEISSDEFESVSRNQPQSWADWFDCRNDISKSNYLMYQMNDDSKHYCNLDYRR